MIEHQISLTPMEDGQAVTGTLRYDPAVPYEIGISYDGADRSYTFVIDRQKMTEALYAPMAKEEAGNVLAGPMRGDPLRTVLILLPTAEQGGGHAFTFYAARRRLWSFIALTLATVPYGSESDQLDMDAVVSRLLGDAS